MRLNRYWLWTLADISISILFAYSAIAKTGSYNAFLVRFSRIPIIYSTETWFLAPVLIAIEILVAVVILFEKSKLMGYLGAGFLLIIFTAFLISKIFGASSEQCMCGGILESLTLPQHIIFNLALLSLIVLRLINPQIIRKRSNL